MAGETTSLAAGAWTEVKTVPGARLGGVLHVYSQTATYSATNQLELNDVMEVGYLPAGITIYGVAVTATDMDTNGSPLLTQKVTVGSTDVVTGITDGRSAATTYYPAPTPYTTTDTELVKITNTAAAATAATGSLKLRWYYTTA